MATEIIQQPDKQNLEQTAASAERLTQAGDALSEAMIFALKRKYLDAPVFENGIFSLPQAAAPIQRDLALLSIEQVGRPFKESIPEYLTAVQTTLAACHDPRYTLIFLIASNGVRNRMYLGVAARESGTQPELFARQLGQFLCSNWPGTRVRSIDNYDEIIRNVHMPLSSYRFARALTGIPSPKNIERQGEVPQNLDRLMRGLRGKPYIYMVIADPMPEYDVSGMISAANTLAGQVHAFMRTSIQRSASISETDSLSTSEGETSSTGVTRGTSESTSESGSKGVLGTALDKSQGTEKALKAAGLGGLSALLVAAGGPFLLSGMLGMFSQLLPSTSASRSSGTSDTTSETGSTSVTRSTSEAVGRSDSLSFSQEYLSKHAESAIKLLDQTVGRFEAASAEGCWNVGVYLISDQEEVAAQAQAQLKALVSGTESSFEPVRIHNLARVWDGQVQAALDAFHQPDLRLSAPDGGDVIRHPIGPAFEGLTTPLNTRELSLLVNLPLRELPGIPMQPTADFSLNPPIPDDPANVMEIGQLLEGGEEVGDELKYSIDVDSLTRHVFVTGITGSGKSNTCRRLLANLMEQGRNFMVIEPAKDEYVQLALAYNQSGTFDREIAVYMPGRKSWGGVTLEELRLNPFDIVELPGAEMQVMPHMDRLKSIFNASFPMQEILPVILEESLVDLYASQGWLEDAPPPPGIERPMLNQLYNRVIGLVREKGYEERITSNITAALRTRIGSLMRGWKGKLFDHPFSTPWADLFDRPVVVNLQQMGDDADKCFTMALLLNFMYEYRQAQHESAGSPESSKLQHLAIFEEAHRVLRAAPRGYAGDANPQAKMGEMFADILAEIRAYGQGLAIIDQVPSKLVPDALKNTNLKIIHRLVAADDREALAAALALEDEQARVISRLKVGQAIIAGVQDDTPSWVKVFYTSLPRMKHTD